MDNGWRAWGQPTTSSPSTWWEGSGLLALPAPRTPHPLTTASPPWSLPDPGGCGLIPPADCEQECHAHVRLGSDHAQQGACRRTRRSLLALPASDGCWVYVDQSGEGTLTEPCCPTRLVSKSTHEASRFADVVETEDVP